MTKGIRENEPDPEIVYADIFSLPRHVSQKHPAMSLYDRAAQFAPSAALTGYDAMIGEEARLVGRRIEPGDAETEALNEAAARLRRILDSGKKPLAEITWFVPDPLKAGGTYETVTERVRRLDPVRGKIVLSRTEGYGNSSVEISLSDVLEIHVQDESEESEL